MEQTFTFYEARKIYEWHFKKEMPGKLSYYEAIVQVVKEIGIEKVLEKRKEIKDNG